MQNACHTSLHVSAEDSITDSARDIHTNQLLMNSQMLLSVVSAMGVCIMYSMNVCEKYYQYMPMIKVSRNYLHETTINSNLAYL